jgi:hypothetical protein
VGGVELRVPGDFAQPERVEIRRGVTPHAVGVDQHVRSDRVAGGGPDVG